MFWVPGDSFWHLSINFCLLCVYIVWIASIVIEFSFRNMFRGPMISFYVCTVTIIALVALKFAVVAWESIWINGFIAFMAIMAPIVLICGAALIFRALMAEDLVKELKKP